MWNLLCPKCSAVLPVPGATDAEQVCSNCGNRVPILENGAMPVRQPLPTDTKAQPQPAAFPLGDLVQAYSEPRTTADKVARVSALLSRGADPNVREQRGHPLLHVAVNDGHLEVVRLLLEHGADVNATNPKGSTALHIAASWADGEMAELLLRYEPDVNIRNNAGRTPLDSTASSRIVSLFCSGVRAGLPAARLLATSW